MSAFDSNGVGQVWFKFNQPMSGVDSKPNELPPGILPEKIEPALPKGNWFWYTKKKNIKPKIN